MLGQIALELGAGLFKNLWHRNTDSKNSTTRGLISTGPPTGEVADSVIKFARPGRPSARLLFGLLVRRGIGLDGERHCPSYLTLEACRAGRAHFIQIA